MLRLALAVLVGISALARAGDVGYIEDFALGDRAKALGQLIPGTEDYYYYHALHSLNGGDFAKVREYFGPWHTRFGQTARLTEIQTRLALLNYEKDAKGSLDYLKQHLGITFHHEKEILGGSPALPVKLDAAAISRATLQARSFANWQHLDNFEDHALDWLASEKLTDDRRRVLLQRLTRPDLPNLVTLVADDLAAPNSPGFGAWTIHRQLTLVQLDELLKKRPDLLNQMNFVQTWLTKLQPGADEDWRHDPAKTNAYLERLLAYVRKLGPMHNSLKAHVLYQKLVFDRTQGKYDKALFLEYLKLPRAQPYMAKRALESDAARRYPTDLNANYEPWTLLRPIFSDEPLVRSYLEYFFADLDSPKEFEDYINDQYLKHLFAETKIVMGAGDAEKWASDLPPELFARLKERIDIDFAFANKTHFAVDEAVKLEVHVKNVSTLIVKVFEINAVNYYRDQKREIDTDVNLDGLVPNWEMTFNYAEPPLRRMARTFEFPQLNKAGVYVIDFIGSGKSSRALVRKGRLRPIVSTTTAGQAISVVDEKNRPVPEASVLLGGTEYVPEKGVTIVPFSTAPGRQPMVLRQGDFASLDWLDHQPENYQLVAGIHVDREQLLSQRLATVLVRPCLLLNGQPVSTKLLDEVKLRITGVDSDGVPTATEVPNFKIFEDRESTHEFRVPPRLTALTITLTAKVRSLTRNQTVDVADSHGVQLNGIAKSMLIEDVFLAKFGADWALEMRGRTGEAKADKPVQVSLKHRDFKEAVTVMLKSDANGRVMLGELPEITSVSASIPGGASHSWTIPADHHTYRSAIDAKAGDVVRVPWLSGPVTRFDASLFEIVNNIIVSDQFEKLVAKDGMLEIAGLAAGDYELWLKATGEKIRIRVVDGVVHAGWVLGQLRHLELAKLAPTSVASATNDADSITIKLKDASPFARVHVIASRYRPEYSAYTDLAKVRDAELRGVYPGFADSVYLTGRAIGDEYRYVLDRKYQKKYPGNMLDRPQLLLNPWAVRVAETGEQLAGEGGAFGGVGGVAPARPAVMPPAESAMIGGGRAAVELSSFIDFLADGSAVLTNIVPDKDGVVTVRKPALGPHAFITVVVVDPISTTVKHLSLPEQPANMLDLRLRAGLDPAGHFTQQKQVSILAKGDAFTLADAAGGRFDAYDSIPKLYALYATLVKDPRFAEFAFLTRWPSLKPEEKRAMYSKYACHELSFFLFKKDPEFFKEVVKPYLANKRDKTFLDQWLLEADLAEYAQPWRHGRLNTAERVLLSQRLPGEPARTARHLADLLKLLPVNLEREVYLFDASVAGSSMEGETMLGRYKEAAGKSMMLGMEGKKDDAKAGDPRAAEPAPATPLAAPSTSGMPAKDRADNANKPALRAMQDADKKKQEESLEKLSEQQRDGSTRRGMSKGGSAGGGQGGRPAGPGGADNFYGNMRDENRKQPAQLYRKVDPTQEWAENNYWKLVIGQQLADLVPVNAFWADYAKYDGKGPFLSKNASSAARNLHEAILALAVTDLPFESGKHETKFENGKMTFSPGGPVIAFHEEVKPAAAAPANPTILVNQNFYRMDDRYREENGERAEKFITDEFVIQTVYGCQVVVTNPTPSRQKLAVLLQIPVGSLPVAGGRPTRTVLLDLEPYRTQTIDYLFYFPMPGDFAHFPVQVAKNEVLVAAAKPFKFHVVAKPSKLDTESWDYVSQYGTSEQVLAYLERENVNALNLERIAWRMKDADFFKAAISLLQARHVYQPTLWSYALMHGDLPAIREYLQHVDQLFNMVGGPIASPLVTYDPVARYAYEHLEYKPLVNARAHSLGQRRQIVNGRFLEQYHRTLKNLSYRTTLTDEDKLAVVYYLLLQDRIEESLAFFGKVNAANVAEKLQYEYASAYLAMFEDPKKARTMAEKHAAHPVDRWRNLFQSVIAQLDEADGKPTKLTDAENRDARQAELAAKAPGFEAVLESKSVNLTWQNLESVTVNYYLMDVELLFSRNPFVQQTGSQFAMIKPNATKTVALPAGQAKLAIPLPDDLAKKNVLIEITAAGKTKALPYYANAMEIKVTEAYGQLKVTDAAGGKPLPKVYVKAYVRLADGTVKFHKDGYTDLRGRFDYASVSTPEQSPPAKYSILILSEEHGAAIREASPPPQ